MAHPSRKIVGPMLRRKPPATADEIIENLITPDRLGFSIPDCVAREWINQAKRKHGLLGSEEMRGRGFRADRELRKRGRYITPAPVPRLSLRQRIARRIARLFRKH